MPHLLNLSHPVPNGVERLFVCHVVHQENPLCASEVGRRDGAETFLPGRIPNLQLDSLGIASNALQIHVSKINVIRRHRCYCCRSIPMDRVTAREIWQAEEQREGAVILNELVHGSKGERTCYSFRVLPCCLRALGGSWAE